MVVKRIQKNLKLLLQMLGNLQVRKKLMVLSKSQKTATAKEYKSTTAALKSKKTPSVARENIQLQRARTAGILSVDNARKTRKVSGPKSKRGN